MLGWSINLFRIFDIQLAVHASFFLLLAYYGYEGWLESGAIGMALNVVLIILFFTCVILHELGHSLTARRYGVNVPRILLLPIGGMAEFDRIPRKPSEELLITIAGPAVNFVIFGVLTFMVGLPPGFPFDPQFEESVVGVCQLLLFWNLIMGTFNLLPVFPMDGGRILRALLARRLSYLRATWWASSIGRVLALSFAVIAVVYFDNVLAGILFVFIYVAGGTEYRMLLRREQEAARWAEMSRRVTAEPTQYPEEPPLLLPRQD